jgi:hypothetical protein
MDIPTNEGQPRKDLEAIQLQEKASLANIQIAKSGYHPTISIIEGTHISLKKCNYRSECDEYWCCILRLKRHS